VVTIAGIGFTISEDGAGAGCTFSIDPSSQNIKAAGGSGFLRVTAESGCQWTAAQNPDGTFITVTSGATGSGNGTVAYQVSPNPTTDSRSGTLKVAGNTFTVTQLGLPVITAVNLQGKNLIVTGRNFDAGSVIVINGMDEVTLHDPGNPASLTGKKSRKHIPVGTPVNVQVRTSDGSISPVFQFTRN